MISSLNTNSSSNSAINSFGSAQSAVHSAQKRIATGKKVADAYDNGAAFAWPKGCAVTRPPLAPRTSGLPSAKA